MAVIEEANAHQLERIVDIDGRVVATELYISDIRERVDAWDNWCDEQPRLQVEGIDVVEGAPAEANASQRIDIASGLSSPRHTPTGGEDFERVFDILPPRGCSETSITPRQLVPLDVPGGGPRACSEFTFCI